MNDQKVQVPEAIKTKAAEIKEKAKREIPRELSPELYKRKLADAEFYEGCYVAFWFGPNYATRYLVVYRTDRRPRPAEYLPWLQSLFESPYAHSGETDYSIEFIEGDIYLPDESMAEVVARSVMDHMEKREAPGG